MASNLYQQQENRLLVLIDQQLEDFPRLVESGASDREIANDVRRLVGLWKRLEECRRLMKGDG